MCKPLVSVVIPYHGSTPEHFLARALRDAKIQTYPNVEIVVVTNRAMQLPFSKDPFYLSYVQESPGIAGARNTGVKHAKGDYIAFLDADDEWYHNKLERCLEHESNFTYHSVGIRRGPDLVGEIRARYSGYIYDQVLIENPIVTSSVVVKRSVLGDVGEFRFAGCEDWDMWLRITRKFPVTVIRERLGVINVLDGSLSSNLDKMDWDRRNVIEHALAEFPHPAGTRGRLYRHHYEKMIRMYFGQRDYEKAEDMFNKIDGYGFPSLGAWARMFVSVVKQ